MRIYTTHIHSVHTTGHISLFKYTILTHIDVDNTYIIYLHLHHSSSLRRPIGHPNTHPWIGGEALPWNQTWPSTEVGADHIFLTLKCIENHISNTIAERYEQLWRTNLMTFKSHFYSIKTCSSNIRGVKYKTTARHLCFAEHTKAESDGRILSV